MANTKTTLIVADARPLFTLAIEGSLDALLIPDTKVIIPDMVMFVVTDKPGSGEILDWLSAQKDSVFIVKTEVFYEFKIIRGVYPHSKIGHREERAAGEVMKKELERASQGDIGKIILLFDESDIKKPPNYIRPFPENVRCMSASLLVDAAKARTEALLKFSKGLLTKEQAINAVGVRDYAELLPMLGDANIPLPLLPQEELDRQVETFVDLFRSS
ncbi:hypothetical protein [Methylobacter tundripaludum]|uniref:hypothetical protein n=1 Tax=Methylobacter tundripaludum TaxID=173365 RepID=UPI00068F3792|nr:hypothetical protein [Methylobacter tundripaludum]